MGVTQLRRWVSGEVLLHNIICFAFTFWRDAFTVSGHKINFLVDWPTHAVSRSSEVWVVSWAQVRAQGTKAWVFAICLMSCRLVFFNQCEIFNFALISEFGIIFLCFNFIQFLYCHFLHPFFNLGEYFAIYYRRTPKMLVPCDRNFLRKAFPRWISSDPARDAAKAFWASGRKNAHKSRTGVLKLREQQPNRRKHNSRQRRRHHHAARVCDVPARSKANWNTMF